MDSELWKPKRRIEENYRKAIQSLLDRIWQLIGDVDDPYEIARRIKRITRTKEFTAYCRAAAGKMVTSLFTDAGRSWRQAARANAKGQMMYQAIQEQLRSGRVADRMDQLIDRNVELIKTLPHRIADDVVNHIREESLKGRRDSDLVDEIQKLFPHKTRADAALIARTETSKASTALTRARAENIGIRWYVWRTSEDSRVRDAHDLMDDVLINWSDPPSPELLNKEKHIGYYHAGEIWNCRCYPEPLVNMGLISWPHKVYSHGTITRMTKEQFEKLSA